MKAWDHEWTKTRTHRKSKCKHRNQVCREVVLIHDVVPEGEHHDKTCISQSELEPTNEYFPPAHELVFLSSCYLNCSRTYFTEHDQGYQQTEAKSDIETCNFDQGIVLVNKVAITVDEHDLTKGYCQNNSSQNWSECQINTFWHTHLLL